MRNVYTLLPLPLSCVRLINLCFYLDRVFVHALNTVKKIPRTGSARPPPADRLKLYGLYKQSMGKLAALGLVNRHGWTG